MQTLQCPTEECDNVDVNTLMHQPQPLTVHVLGCCEWFLIAQALPGALLLPKRIKTDGDKFQFLRGTCGMKGNKL